MLTPVERASVLGSWGRKPVDSAALTECSLTGSDGPGLGAGVVSPLMSGSMCDCCMVDIALGIMGSVLA